MKSTKPADINQAWEHHTHPDRWAITSLFCSQRSNATVVTIHTLNIQKQHKQKRLLMFQDNSENQPRLFQLFLTLHTQHYIHKFIFTYVNLYAYALLCIPNFTSILCHSLLPVTSPSSGLPLILPASHTCLISQSPFFWSFPANSTHLGTLLWQFFSGHHLNCSCTLFIVRWLMFGN